jgi:hypothetical protein
MLSVVHNYRENPRRKKITTRPYKSAEKPLGQSEKCDQIPGLDPAPDPPKSGAHKPPGHSGEPGRRKHNGEAQSRREDCPTVMDSDEATEQAVHKSPERTPRKDAEAPSSSSRRAPPRSLGEADKGEGASATSTALARRDADEGVAAAELPLPPRPHGRSRKGADAGAAKPPAFLATMVGQERRLGSRSTHQRASS